MDIRISRLRAGEVVAGVASLALLVVMLAVHWYGSRTGWQSLAHLRWLAVVTIACGLALAWFQAACRAPAIPVTLSVVVTVLALGAAVWLAVRVIVSPLAHEHAGAAIGLICACGLLAGAFASMRQEGISRADERTDIPTVTPGRA